MPTAPTYGPTKVATSPIPGVRKQSAETFASSGGTLAQAQEEQGNQISRTAGQATQLFTQLAEDERRRADETALLEASNKLAKWENARLYDPSSGALTVKGKDAMPLPEQVGAEFEAVAGDIEGTLSTDRQRKAFARERANRAINLDLNLRRHVFGEMQTYEAGELKTFIANGTEAAIANANDPRRVGQELQAVVNKIELHAPRAGLGPEATKAAIESARTQVHVGVIDRLLENNQEKKAAAYYAEVQDQIAGSERGKVEKALDAGSIRAEAQAATIKIISGGGTLQEQRAKANALDDPKLRDEVKARLEHEAAVSDRDARDREEAASRHGYDIIDKGGTTDNIPPAIWASYSGGTRSAMRSYQMSMAKGTPVETDWPTFYSLMEQASTDPGTFLQQNLLNYKHKLNDTEFKQVEALKMSLRTGDREQTAKLSEDYRTEGQVIDNSLHAAGIDPGKKENATATAFMRQRVGELTARLQKETGKKATNEDIQGVVDSIMTTSVEVPGSWWNIFGPATTSKSVLELTPKDIPSSERKEIDRVLRSHGWPVTDEAALSLFIKAQGKKK